MQHRPDEIGVLVVEEPQLAMRPAFESSNSSGARMIASS